MTLRRRERVPVSALVLLPECQARARLDPDAVERYAEAYREGATLPPVEAYDVGELLIVDGWHRVAAAVQAGLDTIAVEIFEGSRLDAQLAAIRANADSARALPRTNADKRRSVHLALGHPALAGRSDRDVAAVCGVSHTMVGAHRRALAAEVESDSTEELGEPEVESASTEEEPPPRGSDGASEDLDGADAAPERRDVYRALAEAARRGVGLRLSAEEVRCLDSALGEPDWEGE